MIHHHVPCPVCGDVFSTETKLSWWLFFDRCYACQRDGDAGPGQYRLAVDTEQLELGI